MVQVQGTRLEPLERLEPVSSPNFFSLDGKRNTTFMVMRLPQLWS